MLNIRRQYHWIMVSEGDRTKHYKISTANEKRHYDNATKLYKKVSKCNNFETVCEIIENSGLVTEIQKREE